LRDYGAVLWRRKIYVLVAVIVGAGLAFALGNSKQPQYEASAGVLTSLPSASVDPTVVDTDIQILEGSPVRALAVKVDPNASGVTGAQEGDGAVIEVKAELSSPSAAVAAANAFANAYVTYVVKLERAEELAPVRALQAEIASVQAQISALTAQMQTLPSGSEALQVDTAQRNSLLAQQGNLEGQAQQAQASASSAAVTPKVLTSATFATKTGTSRAEYIALGAGAGLAVGLCLAYLFEYLDDSIANPEEAEKELGGQAPVLGTVPDLPRRRGSISPSLVGLDEPGLPGVESFRTLRTALHFLVGDASGKILQFTAPISGEGTTTIATNLAVLLARAGRRVVLVDANLRRPKIHELLGGDTTVGLTSVVMGDVPLETALRPVPSLESLSFLPAGPIPSNPSELLASRGFVELMTSLRDTGACIVMDSGPVIPVSDGLTVASVPDAVVLVTNGRNGSRRRLRRAVSQFRQAQAPLVGVVLNQVGKPVDVEGWKTVSATRTNGTNGTTRTNGSNGNGNGNGKDTYAQPHRI
jgi:capsular exopolysaccharide synthesis family protein